MKKGIVLLVIIFVMSCIGCSSAATKSAGENGIIKKSKTEKIGATITYQNTDAKEVYLTGEIAGESGKVKMIKTAKGQFSANVFLEPGKYRYRFLADGEVKLDDRIKTRIEDSDKGEKYNYTIIEKKSYQKYRGEAPKGKLEKVMIYNKARGKKLPVNVYTPFGYDKNKKYPLLVMIHGYSQTENTYTDIGIQDYADYMINTKIIEPMIICMPYIDAEIKDGDNFTEAITAKKYEDVVIADMMGYMRENYSVYTIREKTAVSGGSMGGMLSFDFALTYPNYFGKTLPIMGIFNIYKIEQTIKKEGKPEFDISIFCGKQDHLIKYNAELDALLDKYEVGHKYSTRDGGHTAEYTESILPMLLIDVSEFFTRY